MSPFLRFYRIFRWFSLAILVLVLFLILRTSEPPLVISLPDAAEHAENKIRKFQSALNHGAEDRLELDGPELNGWLGENLALNKPSSESLAPQTQDSLISLAKTATGAQRLDEASLQQAQSSIREIKVELRSNTVLLYAIFKRFGMDISLELEGRLFVEDGYLRMQPIAGKLGSLPLMAGTLRVLAHRLFDSPDNMEKFKLPPYIKDVAIENGHMVVTSR
jgi:hypothetical protein